MICNDEKKKKEEDIYNLLIGDCLKNIFLDAIKLYIISSYFL